MLGITAAQEAVLRLVCIQQLVVDIKKDISNDAPLETIVRRLHWIARQAALSEMRITRDIVNPGSDTLAEAGVGVYTELVHGRPTGVGGLQSQELASDEAVFDVVAGSCSLGSASWDPYLSQTTEVASSADLAAPASAEVASSADLAAPASAEVASSADVAAPASDEVASPASDEVASPCSVVEVVSSADLAAPASADVASSAYLAEDFEMWRT